MKISIISDIHSNLEALTECIRVAEENGAEKFICLGDCIGYGPDPAAVLDMLVELPNFSCIVGNHEEYLFDTRVHEVKAPVKYAKEWTLGQLSEKHMEYISSLFYNKVENGVTYVHATTHDPSGWVYVTNVSHAIKCMNSASTDLIFYGHVHMPLMFHEKPNNSIEMSRPEQNETIILEQDQRYAINVGSVGQPRDNNPDASFVMYDEEAQSVTFHRVSYDYETTARKIRDYGLPVDFADRIEVGR